MFSSGTAVFVCWTLLTSHYAHAPDDEIMASKHFVKDNYAIIELTAL